jgi:hypothetical protein
MQHFLKGVSKICLEYVICNVRNGKEKNKTGINGKKKEMKKKHEGASFTKVS